ncbi:MULTISPECIES: GbsR/MarR family transcriptional regulator [Streptomyces]|uniref:MarR family transcriptional regulator n=1 Tax=Streptomyces chengmaiensis TaxID=3040919 RepID=A0ABT6HGW0_9ACTN|nr:MULTISPECIES: MarR family transcriptional regulator [Streptomyces]MDH2387815.1 MarR family transcriptional regulator [Streptomyces chengmaiensis]WRQ82265.1 MarR family transcriptional regulator [Streptomyces sp. MUM 178J]
MTDQTGRDEEAVSAFVERFAGQLVEAGMPRMPSRIFAAVLASETGALTSAELSEALTISPAAVSGGIRYLSQVNLISREREPGSRRDRYRVHSNQWYEAMTNRDQILKRWEDTMREGVTTLGPRTSAGRRVAETLEFLQFMEREMAGLRDRWREHRARLFEPE